MGPRVGLEGLGVERPELGKEWGRGWELRWGRFSVLLGVIAGWGRGDAAWGYGPTGDVFGVAR